MAWPNLGNPRPKALGDPTAQKAIIRAATARRKSVPDAPKHKVVGKTTVRVPKGK